MTYPPPHTDLATAHQPTDRPPRPWSVSLAVACAAAATVALALSAATGIEEWLRTPDLITQAAAATDAPADEVSAERTMTAVFYPVILLVHAVVAAAYVGLSIPVWRGRNGARIAMCVVAGIGMLCCGGVLALLAVAPDSADEGAFAAELDRLHALTSPAWTDVTNVLSSVLLAVTPPVALILLLIPPSNRFFRKPRPSGPFGGYGQPYPGYYIYPGQQAPPQPGPPQ